MWETIVGVAKEPSSIALALGVFAGAATLMARGAKAKVVDAAVAVMTSKFEDHEAIERAHDAVIDVEIAAIKTYVGDLKEEMTGIREDVREVSRDVKRILSNGHFKDVQL